MRYFFEIAYNGGRYAGWQSQANATGIQSVLEECLSLLLRHPVKIVGSGRTDAGVHCLRQFFHADFASDINAANLQVRMNSFLPPDVAIRSIRQVKDDAHARYSAIQRTYHYRITTVKDPFLTGYALYYGKPLDIQTMNKAAALLLGMHDFACFSKVKTDVHHFLCHITKAQWNEQRNRLSFQISSNRFLRGMVRAIVGTLLEVGSGKLSADDFRRIIKSKDRKKAGANAPAHGLFLVQVRYKPSIFVS